MVLGQAGRGCGSSAPRQVFARRGARSVEAHDALEAIEDRGAGEARSGSGFKVGRKKTKRRDPAGRDYGASGGDGWPRKGPGPGLVSVDDHVRTSGLLAPKMEPVQPPWPSRCGRYLRQRKMSSSLCSPKPNAGPLSTIRGADMKRARRPEVEAGQERMAPMRYVGWGVAAR